MDNQELYGLVDESKKSDLAALITAKENSKQNVLENASKAHLAAFERATKMLDDFMSEVQQATGEAYLDNRNAVVRYLKERGFKIGKQKVYDDCKKGILPVSDDGRVLKAAVDLYAKALEVHSTDSAKLGELSEKKLQKEIEKLTVQIDKERHNLEKDQGRFIPREDFEREMAGRAAVFDVGLRHEIRIHVAELIAIVGGEVTKQNAFMDRMNEIIDAQLNTYVQTDTYQVVFLGDED